MVTSGVKDWLVIPRLCPPCRAAAGPPPEAHARLVVRGRSAAPNPAGQTLPQRQGRRVGGWGAEVVPELLNYLASTLKNIKQARPLHERNRMSEYNEYKERGEAGGLEAANS